MQRATRQRVGVMDLLEHATQFLSAQQIHNVLTHQGQTLGPATVYRTLQALTDTGTPRSMGVRGRAARQEAS